MAKHRDLVRDVCDRLDRAGLMPPIRGVEQRGGGWVHIVVMEPISEELRSRVLEALGPGHWTLREGPDGTSYR